MFLGDKKLRPILFFVNRLKRMPLKKQLYSINSYATFEFYTYTLTQHLCFLQIFYAIERI